MTQRKSTELILASGSPTRRGLLEAAGVPFRIEPADVDEDAIRASLYQTNPDETPTHVARVLAAAKAQAVSRRHPAALVLGADQVLEAGREIYTKAADMAGARRNLLALAGRTHRLLSAQALAHDGKVVWQHLDAASLAMRDASPAFIDDYLARAGETILKSVGCYELEGLGIQLFERIEGDYFTILGLPLLPLLAELRSRGVIAA